MRKLLKPTIDPQHVFEKCISGVTDVSLKTRLKSEINTAVTASREFEGLAHAKRLDLFPLRSTLGTSITREEMKGLYKTQLSSKSGAARDVYNALRNLAPNKKCPLCGVGIVSTLDHHLPQAKYADITVTPINLVPACSDCNKKKMTHHPKTEYEQTIHPYFDDFATDVWVHADVEQGPPPIITFKVVSPAKWSAVSRARAEKHFSVFGLSTLFGANAADELITLRDHLASLDRVDIQPYLQSEASRYSVICNSWQSAMYRALASDVWFHSGGFRSIPDS